MKRQAAEARGRLAETIAANFLRLKGWTILDRRVRTPAGEVDIVMRKPGLVAFVEVKARKIRPRSISRSTASGWCASRRRRNI